MTTDAALRELGPKFDAIYASHGRPSIPPEKLLRALLLQVLYTVRSERMLMERLDYNFLFRWFVGLSIDDPVWDVTVFTKNRERLLAGEVAQGFFNAVVNARGLWPGHVGRRQGLRSKGAGAGAARAWSHPARRAEAQQRDRWPHHAPPPGYLLIRCSWRGCQVATGIRLRILTRL